MIFLFIAGWFRDGNVQGSYKISFTFVAIILTFTFNVLFTISSFLHTGCSTLASQYQHKSPREASSSGVKNLMSQFNEAVVDSALTGINGDKQVYESHLAGTVLS